MNDFAEKIKEDEDKFVEEQMAEIEDPEDEDAKALQQIKFRLEYEATLYMTQDEFKERFHDMKSFKVFKYGNFMQSLFYFLGYTKDNLTEEGTHRFFWKTAKSEMDEEFLKKMKEYEFRGPKTGHFEKYQTINYVEKNI